MGFLASSFLCSYLGFRLLGSALPLLSVEQLKEVLSGDVMLHYGEHVVSAQVRQQAALPVQLFDFAARLIQVLNPQGASNWKQTVLSLCRSTVLLCISALGIDLN